VSITVQKLRGENWFKISDYDKLRPFFMNIVSDSNHWMFISSNGGLTAGRKNPEFSLFPYYTVDKLEELADTTGNKTIFQIPFKGEILIWEPFSERYTGRYVLTRNLYKSSYGNKVMFEEINEDLGLTFRYEWNSSNLFGFVKKSTLINHSDINYRIKILDGIQNVMPHGVESDLQTKSSNLADAYKRTELVKESGLGIFALSAIIVDKAEPSEALKANVVWSMGLEKTSYLLSSLQLSNYRKKESIIEEYDIKGEKGAYFVHSEILLESDKEKQWSLVANVNQNHSQVVALNQAIQNQADLYDQIEKDINRGTQNLLQLIAGADGLQSTADKLKDARHYSNVLYNIMRGGIFDDNYTLEKKDFTLYLSNANKTVFSKHQDFIQSLTETFDLEKLNSLLAKEKDPDLIRLCKEYLPLKFSRRHGDPSRPWNQFSINTHSEIDGSKVLDYEGNWRDIFQNWEALVHSYPEFTEGVIYKFLNTSTLDGYNPYRVTKGGFDWETIEPDNPWSYIGYWGDHQIIYLLKFLEFYQKHKPKALDGLFNKDLFTYANVPYRIKSYHNIADDPKNTIDFDEELDTIIRRKVEENGADGSLVGSKVSEIHHVNFIEKILVTVLAKVSNFIPEGGIWMNTQRPEWNDANNALVGNGVSMVTLYYLRRFLKFFEGIIAQSQIEQVAISKELHTFFAVTSEVLEKHKLVLQGSLSDKIRKDITDALGQAGSDYRNTVYDHGFSGATSELKLQRISGFINDMLEYAEHTIRANRRADHLYHSYNLMSMTDEGVTISHLSEMLEGQVAAISSGCLNADEVVAVLDALRESALYREDQNSYLLYPNKELPGFLEKNTIPRELVGKSALLTKMVEENNLKIISKDIEGNYHFNGNFKNARDVRESLEQLKSTPYNKLVESESKLILDIFEEVFDHKSFTGRSGTFFAFEGLGSIYWHMVSKLHLAVNEACIKAIEDKEKPAVIDRLIVHHTEIEHGIGIHKTPEVHGAFPTDPYSHTPFHRGAQQPGMTGQVKEDILVRFGELGIFVIDGQLIFNPGFLKKDEFLDNEKEIEFVNVRHEKQPIQLEKQSLCFSYCQVPVIYKVSDNGGMQVEFKDGTFRKYENTVLDKETSSTVFKRTGDINQITVFVSDSNLLS